jgi:imidazolonepropionase-like amidohydrolase
MRAALALLALCPAPRAAQDLAVRGEVVHTAAGAPITDGIVLVLDGRIAAVGPAAEVDVPADLRVLEAAVVTPGLVDAHSVVGLAGYLNYAHDQEQLERSAAMQPELRAIDAYDPREPLIAWLRAFGVTTVHTGHAPGAVISGQTLVAKTIGDTVDEAVITPYAMLACTLGDAAEREGGEPGTRAKAAALLRAELVRAQEYARKLAQPAEDPDAEQVARDLRLEALLPVLSGERPLLVTADRSREILTALRIAAEFDLRVVLDGAAEAHLVTDAIVRAGVPVLLHATMRRSHGDAENLTLEAAARLRDAGLRVALQSGYESYVPKTRVVLFEAAVAAANGLGFERALETITIDAARIVGVDERVGSLEVGKDGDVALYDGDPFEYTTHCIGVVIEGRVVSESPR